MSRRRVEVTKEELEWAMTQTNSARSASQHLGLMYTTFIRRCKEYGVYKTNQGGRGTSKPNPKARIPLEKILSNEHFMTGGRVKKKLIEAGLVKDECDECKLQPVWNGKKLTIQLDHIDGDRTNNARANLRLLCPNCHSQTDTFSKGKNRKKKHAAVGKLVDPAE